jgi:hypothetical protein
MLKKQRWEILREVENNLMANLSNPWLSYEMQEHFRNVMMSMAMTIVDSIYDQQELEEKAEQILLDNNQDS